MRNKLEAFFLRNDQFCEQYFQKHTMEDTSKKTSHKTGLTIKRIRNIVQSDTKFASVFFSHWYFNSFSFNSNAVPSLTPTVAFLTPFIHISCLIKENFRSSFLPLLVFLVWDFLGLRPVTTGLVTSALPLDAALSGAAAGTTVVGFTHPLAARLFGTKQKSIRKAKLFKNIKKHAAHILKNV